MKISVVVPVYNTSKYLRKCLDSLVNQTFKDIEIICVNDGSTDSSLSILQEYKAKYNSIKIISQENQGLSSARNTGIEAACGEYIGFVDSDDWVDLDFFAKLYEAILYNNCDIAVASIIRKRTYFQKYRVHYTEENIYTTLEDKINICSIPKCCYVWNKLYKKDLIKDIAFEKNVFFEDMLWIPQVLQKSDKLVTVCDTNYYYRVNQSSIVKKNQSKKKQMDFYNAKKSLIKFFDENKLKLSLKDRCILKSIKYFLNIPVFTIKELENTECGILFGTFKIFEFSKSINRYFYKICGIKITIRKNRLSKKEYEKLNYSYEHGEGIVPNVKNKYETLDELINTNKSMARFGDGEFNLIWGENLPFQKYDEKLAEKLKEVLLNNNEKIMVGIPNVFGNIDISIGNAVNFWRKYCVNNREEIYRELNMSQQYYDSTVTRIYIDEQNKIKSKELFEKYKKIWNEKDVIFVEGEGSRLGYGNDLFANADTIQRIICPATNAFAKYDEILKECKKQPKEKLFILALGPTATVLAYDLAQLGYRALDLGHIDIEYEWFLLGAKKKVPIKNKYVNETRRGKIVTSLDDDKYKSEIICNLVEVKSK